MRYGRFSLISAAAIALLACGNSGGGSTSGSGGASMMCFSALAGPPTESCEGYALGLSCGFGDEPAYSCTCTKTGTTQKWVCEMSGPGSSSSSGTGGMGGGGVDAGAEAGP